MNTRSPLNLLQVEALKIEQWILTLQPFPKQAWLSAVENYLILRWVLGLGPATAGEIVDALERAKFYRTRGRTTESCLSTVYRVLRGRKLRVTDWGERRQLRYHPRQYAWHPNKTLN